MPKLIRPGEFKLAAVKKALKVSRADMDMALAFAIAEAYDRHPAEVISPPKSGGNPTCYTIYSEMNTIIAWVPAPKIQLWDGPWEELLQLARRIKRTHLEKTKHKKTK